MEMDISSVILPNYHYACKIPEKWTADKLYAKITIQQKTIIFTKDEYFLTPIQSHMLSHSISTSKLKQVHAI